VVGPVQAVGLSAADAGHAIHDVRCARYLVLEARRLCSAGAGRFSSTEGMSSCPRHAPLSLMTLDRADLLSRLWLDRGVKSVAVCPHAASRSWQPWPAELPLVDRVTRWWPSDDWPPAATPDAIEDHHPDAPVQIIDWRDAGGLLDLRA